MNRRWARCYAPLVTTRDENDEPIISMGLRLTHRGRFLSQPVGSKRSGPGRIPTDRYLYSKRTKWRTPVPTTIIPGAATAPELRAHLAVPPVGDGPWPGVVVLHEAYGLTDDIRQQADRLAAAGYLAVAPDLFTAGGALRCLRSTVAAVISGQGPAFGDIDATRR